MFEDWKQIVLDGVIAVEYLLKTFCFNILLYTYFIWFRIFGWLLNLFDLLADFLLHTVETHPFSSG